MSDLDQSQKKIKFTRTAKTPPFFILLKYRQHFFTVMIITVILIICYQIIQLFLWPDFKPDAQLSQRGNQMITACLAENGKPKPPFSYALDIIRQTDPISAKLFEEAEVDDYTWSTDSTKVIVLLNSSPLNKETVVVIWDRAQMKTLWLPIAAASLPLISPDGKRLIYIVKSMNNENYPTEMQLFDLIEFENRSVFRSFGKSYSTGIVALICWNDDDLVLFKGSKGARITKTSFFYGAFSISSHNIGIIEFP